MPPCVSRSPPARRLGSGCCPAPDHRRADAPSEAPPVHAPSTLTPTDAPRPSSPPPCDSLRAAYKAAACKVSRSDARVLFEGGHTTCGELQARFKELQCCPRAASAPGSELDFVGEASCREMRAAFKAADCTSGRRNTQATFEGVATTCGALEQRFEELRCCCALKLRCCKEADPAGERMAPEPP